MYKCKKCGNVFENVSKGIFDIGYDPDYDGYASGCPDCGSDDYIEVEPCKVCGEYISANSYFGLCGNCEEKTRKDMKEELYNFCKNMEEHQFDILEDILSQLELTYVIRNIKNEMESEEE